MAQKIVALHKSRLSKLCNNPLDFFTVLVYNIKEI